MDELEEHKLFFFGQKYDAKGNLVLGNGTDNNHFNICFSSKALLKRLLFKGQYHVDCTYKIIKYFNPVLVFGISDYKRQFFPVAFMITSHETAADFIYFYNNLNQIAADLNIDFTFNPEKIVSDACEAMHNALTKVYENIEIQMCWFHVKLNAELFISTESLSKSK